MAGNVDHEYHLVEPSPWPVVGSFSLLFLALGAVFWMKGDYELFPGTPSSVWSPYVFFIGVAGVLYTMYEWWADVIKEAQAGDHTPVVQIGLRYGMILFIASEVMFFVAWFWAFFNGSLFPTEAIGSVWPPEGIETFDPWHIPFMNTLILLLSGTTVTWAHHALIEDNRDGLKQGLWLTVGLGVIFTAMQAYEYAHATFTIDSGIYGSTFYMATGFHGFHVIVGTIFLAICLMRSYRGHFKPEHHFGFEAAAWYWHFVDVVWLFLFAFVYVVYGGTPAH